jgi:hypothetical protein
MSGRGFRPGRRWRRLAAAILVASMAGLSPFGPARTARAYDPATTQPGVIEKAALKSRLHRALVERWGQPLGLFEPLRLRVPRLAGRTGPVPDTTKPMGRVAARLARLDPAEGYRPSEVEPGQDPRAPGGQESDQDGGDTSAVAAEPTNSALEPEGVLEASALGWLAAGAALSETPPELGRNHFLDPRTGAGLDDSPGLSGFLHELRLTVDGVADLGEVATGQAFDLSGLPATAWVMHAANSQSLPAFWTTLARAGGAVEAADREAALVQALLALGGLAAVLVDMGDPARVRNDFRAAFLSPGRNGGWDRRSDYERFCARRYGRFGVPEPDDPVVRPNVLSFFTAKDGQGLADRTNRRFFSAGTVPVEVAVDAWMTPRLVRERAGASLVYPAPQVGPLALRRGGITRHVMVEGRRALAYRRTPTSVRFFLDAGVYEDTAATLLAESGAYAAGLFDHLLRVRAVLEPEGRSVSVRLEGLSGTPGAITVQLFAEDAKGRRDPLGPPSALMTGADPPALNASLPAGVAKVAAVVQGEDGAGRFVALAEIPTP